MDFYFLESSAVDVVKSREGGWHGWGWGSGGGGIHSLEGALLSLAFLTFAVFLINLIQVKTPLTSVKFH